MSLANVLVDTIRKLSALEMRTEDVRKSQDRIETKLDSLLERITRLESDYEHLKTNVRNDVLSNIKADLARAQVYLELQSRGLFKSRDDSKDH